MIWGDMAWLSRKLPGNPKSATFLPQRKMKKEAASPRKRPDLEKRLSAAPRRWVASPHGLPVMRGMVRRRAKPHFTTEKNLLLAATS
jgi:hypothetical protein